MPIPAVFDELYRAVPAALRDELRRFRETHPYRRITTAGAQWEYIASGAGSRAVLLLGGGASVGETAFRRITALEGEYRVISPSYPALARMAPVCDGLAAILDAEGIQQTHIFGHSLGSAVAHAFVRRHPGRVDRLALDAFGLYTPQRRKSYSRLMRIFLSLPYAWLAGYYRRLVKRLTAAAPGPESAFWSAYADELFTRLLSKEAGRAQFLLLLDMIDHMEAYGAFQPVERPGRVLIIRALDDRGFLRKEQEALIRTYPGALVHTFERGGHLSGFTRAAEFDRYLYGFLAGEGDAAAVEAPPGAEAP